MADEPVINPVDAPPDVTDLQRERDDYYDRLLRKTAAFDNYRRRVHRWLPTRPSSYRY